MSPLVVEMPASGEVHGIVDNCCPVQLVDKIRDADKELREANPVLLRVVDSKLKEVST